MQSFLKYVNQYVSLSKAEESLLLAKLRPRTYLKAQYIIQAGDICKEQTYVVSGTVRTFHADDRGNEHVINFGIENWWVGDLESFSKQTPAKFNTQCLENTKVIQISYDDLEEIYKDVPIMERFFRILVQNAYANMSKRIARSYSLSARERYILFCEEYPKILKRIPQYMIASYLGITKEFLSSLRNQITKELKS